MERNQLRREYAKITAALPADLIEAGKFAREHAVLKHPVSMLNKTRENRITVRIGLVDDNSNDGSGEWFKIKRADGTWTIEEQEIIGK